MPKAKKRSTKRMAKGDPREEEAIIKFSRATEEKVRDLMFEALDDARELPDRTGFEFALVVSHAIKWGYQIFYEAAGREAAEAWLRQALRTSMSLLQAALEGNEFEEPKSRRSGRDASQKSQEGSISRRTNET